MSHNVHPHNPGDLGWRVPHGVRSSRMGGQVVISGRLKDIIVLASGVNIDPQVVH